MQKIQLDQAIRDFLLKEDSMTSFELKGKIYRMDRPAGHGYLGVVWKVFDELNRPRAAKFTTYSDYVDKSYLQELALAAELETSSELFARLIDAGYIELNVPERTSFICFIEDWIEGKTLKVLINEGDELITPSFLLGYVGQLASALSILNDLGLCHDDLHAGNVILTEPRVGLSRNYRVKVIDTGSLKRFPALAKKDYDDHERFLEHLIAIRNCIVRRKRMTHIERKFISEVDKILVHMADEDPTIALRDPAQVIAHFETAWTKASSIAQRPATMNNPFEYISAEYIADDKLLEQIFAKSCPWLERIESADPCLVTGPRGCGKSTIFRWLSLSTHLHKSAAEIDMLKISGFYVSCSIDLQNRLGWIVSDAQAEGLQHAITHYFNLVVTREVLHTLIKIAKRDDREQYWQFGENQERVVHQFIVTAIHSTGPRLQGVPRLVQANELVESEMYRVYAAMLRGQLKAEDCTTETFLGDLTTQLVKLIPHFISKKITFLVDDFSIHRIPAPVQKILNRIIWERRPSHMFKLSSEKHGAILLDVRDASADLTREMNEIDCGKEYIQLDNANDKAKAKRFALELLQNRLRAANYQGDAQTLLGPSRWPERSLAQALAAKREGRADDQYHGIDVIANLCSGDVSSLLYIYREIFERGTVTRSTVTQIPKQIQNAAIREVSRRMTEATRSGHPFGRECYRILLAFGTLVRRILKDGRPQRNRTGDEVPTQAPRIELDRGLSNEPPLVGDLLNLERELLRRAIFIDLDVGSSRHQRPTLRWHLRRVYLPSFSAALSKNDAVKGQYDWLKFLLSAPDDACDNVWKRWPRRGAQPGGKKFKKRPGGGQGSLPLKT
jgi:hypothetical protein